MNKKRFTVDLLTEVDDFLNDLSEKCVLALDQQMKIAERLDIPPDSESLAKLQGTTLYEFRRTCDGVAIRIFCFYDKTNPRDTRMVCCHAITKTTQKTPKKEIAIALRRRDEYFA